MRLDTYKVPDANLKISAQLPMPQADISGGSSSTSTVSMGQKAKKLSVALTIAFKDANLLTELIGIAEQTDDAGDARVWQIIDPLAKAMQIRQVKFTDALRVTEADSLQAWSVTFSLVEHNSVPEKKEARRTPEPVAESADPGVPVATESTPQTAAPELNGVEKYLKQLDNALA